MSQVQPQTFEIFRKLKDKLESVISNEVPEMSSADHFENLYKICANIVHPYDSDYVEFLNVLFNKRLSKRNLQGCCEILRLILKNQYQNLPKYYSQIGITEMVAAKNCNTVNLLEEGEMPACYICLARKYVSSLLGKYSRFIEC